MVTLDGQASVTDEVSLSLLRNATSPETSVTRDIRAPQIVRHIHVKLLLIARTLGPALRQPPPNLDPVEQERRWNELALASELFNRATSGPSPDGAMLPGSDLNDRRAAACNMNASG